MKKILFFVCVVAMVCCACSKSCTCSISSSNLDQEIEIAYNDDCGNYSNDNRSCR
ncbi:MAG: hypothetical protein J6P65_08080 [Bacteroidales bacterium]|nr:hypothetical protein [Bacteroidales bacterium]